MSHPMQPIEFDDSGVIRFKQNKVVRYLLEACISGRKTDLNDIWVMPFSAEDMEQFYQLIGYSVSAYGDIFDDGQQSVKDADAIAEELYNNKKS